MGIPRRFEPYLFSLFLSGMMSFLVSGVATARAAGIDDGFVGLWLSSWMFAWAVAFPAAVTVAPIARKIARVLVADDPR
ncbi:MAG: DUF2798 domain-containing protein [Pseudomonadota bacterium]